jgi:dTDP-4-dehydrorhamnose reductase
MNLVLGASGQLGQCFNRVVSGREENNWLFPEEGTANIMNFQSLEALFRENKPIFVVNCAAYTAVDKAEDEAELCRKINVDGALNIAILCRQYGATMIHVSTDFVFKGDTPSLLNEQDVAQPINVYGLTKLEGELAIMKELPEHFILRTSWLYSEYASNFVKTMLRLAADRESLNVIVDQIGTPTYAIDLVGAILTIIESGKTDYGVYHYSNEGVTSWYDFAVAIFQLSNLNVKVMPISTSEYRTAAVRPKFSVMDKSKIKGTFGLQIPYWRDSLAICLETLTNK